MYHTYPHIDFTETGKRGARLLLQILDGKVKPVTAKVEIPALVRGDELITATGCFGRVIDDAKAIEASPGGLSAGMFIGNPFTDVPELRSYTVVCTDRDVERAKREAIRVAERFWPDRQKMQALLDPVPAAVKQAASLLGQGTVAMVDAADATSSGASGDSNVILRELVAARYLGRALLPIVDPGAVEVAFATGVGGEAQISVGGWFDKKRFTPLPLIVRVRMLSDGRFRSESFNQEWFSDRTAVLQAGNITLVATTRPVHLFDRSLFYAHGQDPRHFDLVVVKSPHCQHRMYAEWCVKLIHADAAGSASANLPTLGHTICRRPVFPLDANVSFKPEPRVFSR